LIAVQQDVKECYSAALAKGLVSRAEIITNIVLKDVANLY